MGCMFLNNTLEINFEKILINTYTKRKILNTKEEWNQCFSFELFNLFSKLSLYKKQEDYCAF